MDLSKIGDLMREVAKVFGVSGMVFLGGEKREEHDLPGEESSLSLGAEVLAGAFGPSGATSVVS
ncbi:hypothetical protein SESBI_16661 [Sesbania bispinosa]|nr:hypothetical protein SESBI_16661 [Sesbania bispinosa]